MTCKWQFAIPEVTLAILKVTATMRYFDEYEDHLVKSILNIRKAKVAFAL